MSAAKRLRALPWGLWLGQILAILRLEFRKTFLSRRAIPIHVLALMPVVLLGGRALATLGKPGAEDLGRATQIYATVFQSFILRFVVFFGCAGIFSNLFRAEVLEKTLHYYLLAPVRREVLVVGKYLSGLVASVLLFAGGTAVTQVLLYLPHGSGVFLDQGLGGSGLRHAIAYVGIAALGCVGYGAVFLAMGLYFRNPMIPAVAFLGWESILFLLPRALKKISVFHYLQSLCPVPVSEGPFALLAEPTSVWVAVPGLMVLTAVVVALAAAWARRTEIAYGAD